MHPRFSKRCLTPIIAAALAVAYATGAAPAAKADDVIQIIVKKDEEKKKNRWSLDDWLETRDRMRLQDLWLAMHTPNPYEFYLGGNYQLGNFNTGASTTGYAAQAGAYASIFGLEIQAAKEAQTQTYHAMAHLRAFGFHDQATNITLELGMRNENDGAGSYHNPLAGVSLTAYVSKFFGIQGLYRHYFASPPNSTGITTTANRYEGGAFIDFKFFRVFGTYYNEPVLQYAPLIDNNVTRSGVQVGSKIYF